MGITYDGKTWKVYYYDIGEFERDLKSFGNFLDELEANDEPPFAIVPNVGRTKAAFGGVGIVGLAVVARKAPSSTA